MVDKKREGRFSNSNQGGRVSDANPQVILACSGTVGNSVIQILLNKCTAVF